MLTASCTSHAARHTLRVGHVGCSSAGMSVPAWYVLAGALLAFMALAGTLLKKLPLSTSLLYLVVGFALGPLGAGVLRIDVERDAGLLSRIAEGAVLVSLFTTGLKSSAALDDARWRLPLRLATGSMLLAIGALTALAMAFGFPAPIALLLGSILAPTDPVLASDVQLENHEDRDRLRFALSGEAGLNDATAAPFVALALAWTRDGTTGSLGEWLLFEVGWSFAVGSLVGWVLGHLLGRAVVYLRTTYQAALGLDEFLALSLIALSYGLATLLHASGFAAVFATGIALRRWERTRPRRDGARAQMTAEVLSFNERLEHLVEVVLVVIVAASLRVDALPTWAPLFVALGLFVVRPLSVFAVVRGEGVTPMQRNLMGWFGIRGIGSIYYLFLALARGVPDGRALASVVILFVSSSIVVHGISVTPLMARYERSVRRAKRTSAPAHERPSRA
jgi:NhaP-type Na+/H+ or K+/H+ antiporter